MYCLLELSNMPIADLLQLKERLGEKMYAIDLWVYGKSAPVLVIRTLCNVYRDQMHTVLQKLTLT